MNVKLFSLVIAFALVGCGKAPDPLPAPSPDAAIKAAPVAAVTPAASKQSAKAQDDAGIAWQKGDVDTAFAAAKSSNKPVFLYWGAVWCPPCNQVKATIFNRQDFIERSRFFVPVYIDGDSPSAQKLGARFKVSGYPTMILFKPDGSEITRLPGEVDAEQYMRVLAMGMSGARPVKETLAAALGAGAGAAKSRLAPEDWRMLAYYSWITDDAQLVPKDQVAGTLARLAQACPADQAETATRLKLQALSAAATAKDVKPRDDKVAASEVIAVLENPARARENFDLLTYYAAEMTGYLTLPKSAERAQLASVWDATLQRFAADATLSTADRLAAVTARVLVAKLDAGKDALPASLQASVREQVVRAERDTTDVYARQSVISAAAEALTEAGLIEASDALLTSELKRSHSPYYFMLGLAANAKKRDDKRAALDWYEKAYAAADGPATRLQWGVSYVNALVELAPADSARIEKTATQVIGELDPKPDTFHARNRRALERMGNKLSAWNKGKEHNDSLRRIRAQMATVCAKLPGKDSTRATCDGVLNPTKSIDS